MRTCYLRRTQSSRGEGAIQVDNNSAVGVATHLDNSGLFLPEKRLKSILHHWAA
jgi:hypothetical protein